MLSLSLLDDEATYSDSSEESDSDYTSDNYSIDINYFVWNLSFRYIEIVDENSSGKNLIGLSVNLFYSVSSGK